MILDFFRRLIGIKELKFKEYHEYDWMLLNPIPDDLPLRAILNNSTLWWKYWVQYKENWIRKTHYRVHTAWWWAFKNVYSLKEIHSLFPNIKLCYQ